MSQFVLTPEQDLIRSTVAEFAASRVAPRAEAIDRESRFPRDLLQEAGALGLLAILVPTEAGGAGADTVSFVAAVEELSKASASMGLLASTANALVATPLAAAGRKEELQSQASGERLGALATHEPDAGSDLKSIRTKVERRADGYVVSGSKSYVIGAPEADLFLVLAREKDAVDPGLFLVPKGAGVTVGRPEELLGVRGTGAAQVFFKNVKLPRDARLGAAGEGSAIVERARSLQRLGVAAMAVGVGQASLEASVAFADERTQFDRKIREFQAIQSKLAEMATAVRAGRLLVQSAAALRDAGSPFETEAEMAKNFVGESAKMVTREAVKLHGGSGFMKEYKVERYNRDARAVALLAGTTEVLRSEIARSFYAGSA